MELTFRIVEHNVSDVAICQGHLVIIELGAARRHER
jgi:hypothetical protein